MTNDSIQTTSLEFFAPITLSYVAVCLTWVLIRWMLRERWPEEEPAETDHRWLDFLMVVIAGVGVFGIGAAYRNDLLLPTTGGPLDALIVVVNLCLPYSPIFAILVARRQSFSTVWINLESIHWKLLVGLLASVIGVAIFVGLRSEWNRVGEILADCVSVHSLSHAPAVFLEAVAVAFVFVRLKWVTGAGLAVLTGSLLFAAGHIPSGIESGRNLFEILAFFVFNTAIAAFIFAVVVRSRDVIWIAVPHYFLDVAIGAFK